MDILDDIDDDARPSPRISYDPETGPGPYAVDHGRLASQRQNGYSTRSDDLDMGDEIHEIEGHDPKLDNHRGHDTVRFKIGAGVCLVVVALIFIIVAAVNGARKVAYSQSAAAHQHQVLLQPPPQDLSQKCNEQNVLSERGFFECEERCEAADCCSYPTNLALSCLNDSTEDSCFEYHQHCSVLMADVGTIPNTSNLPEAPQNLSDLCSDDSLKTTSGFEQCVNECIKAECCWQKDGHIEPCPKEAVCGGYAECFAMDALDFKNDKITTEIAETCADANISSESGRSDCILACSNAACCFDPLSRCPHENADFCDQYGPCQKVYDASGNVIQDATSTTTNDNPSTNDVAIPTAPLFLKFSCTQESLNTLPGFEECEGACLEAECCWKTNTCTAREECTGYQGCHNLLKDQDAIPNGSISQAPSYLATACQPANLDSESGLAMCQKACYAAKCCWSSKDAPATCQEQQACNTYAESCPNLEAHSNSTTTSNGVVDTTSSTSGNVDGSSSAANAEHLNAAPDDLYQVCDADKLATRPDDFFACRYACTLAECCWKNGATNSCVGNPLCQGWATCTNLNGATAPPDVTSAPATSGTQQQSAAATTGSTTPAPSSTMYSMQQIFDACMNHDNAVANSNHKSLCEIVCEAGSCCYDDTACPSSVQCHNYDPCHVLHPQISTAVSDACSNTSDLSDCVSLCSHATCCYTNDIEKICEKTHPEIVCYEYNACEVIYRSASQSQP